jgi:hypothetical protein
MATRNTYSVKTSVGTFSRTSSREYKFCVVRIDGWHQFSQSKEAAERELRYQQNRGRDVILLPVTKS